ncbi:MAG: hypothetical protein AAFR31_13840 [Cyanobacteria bacterium J06627_8]
MFKTLRGTLLIGLGYMLSPLSWWNDLFFNLPIAYAFGYVVSLGHSNWFLPATVVGYWLSNVLGFVLMQIGVGDVAFKDRPRNPKKDLLISLGTSTLYTVAVLALFQLHIFETPEFQDLAIFTKE